jgi:predicted dehydrogenase
MSERSVRTVAGVGCGVGRSHIAEGYRRHPDKFQVLALCDIDEGRLAKLGDEFSVRRRTKSFDEVLRMDDVNIVDICTPPMLHFGQIWLHWLSAKMSSAKSRLSARSLTSIE